MKNLNEIESELKVIANANGFTGDSVDLLVKLVAYNRFEAESSVRVALLESVPDRATNINSIITHAMNEMYSIYRGKNSMVYVKAKVNGNIQLDTFDKVFTNKKSTLVYSHCIDDQGTVIRGKFDFIYGRTYTLVLINADKVKTNILSVTSNNLYILESLDSDISETYQLVYNVGNDLPIKVTKDFGEHIDRGLEDGTTSFDPLAMDLTITDYGLRVYAPTETGFNASSDYTLTYIPFSDLDLEVSDLDKLTIPGFLIDTDELVTEDHVPRELVTNFLYNLKREAVTQNRTRANSDIIDSFKTSFSPKIRDVRMKDYDLQKDILRINYIPLKSDVIPYSRELTEEDRDYFVANLLYYVTKNIEFIPLYDETDSKEIKVEIDMVINETIDVNAINSYLKTFEYKINGKINKHEILGTLNEFDGVKYCNINIYDLSKEDPNIPEDDLIAGNDSYFILTPNLTYSYRI